MKRVKEDRLGTQRIDVACVHRASRKAQRRCRRGKASPKATERTSKGLQKDPLSGVRTRNGNLSTMLRKAASWSQRPRDYTAVEAERPPVHLLIGGDSGKVSATNSQFELPITEAYSTSS